MEGSTARLQCRVISDTPLFLQWLKRLDRLSPYEAHRQAVAGMDYARPDPDGVLQVQNKKKLMTLYCVFINHKSILRFIFFLIYTYVYIVHCVCLCVQVEMPFRI